MKGTSKIFAVILALVLVTGVFSSCGKKEAVHTGDKYSFWVTLDTSVSQTQKSFNDLLMFQEMSKRTGTQVEFIHPSAGSTGTEAFQILLASGDYPDMIQYSWGNYAGGPDQAINDEVIIALNDYMEEYAPNYNYYMEGEGGKENDYLYKAAAISNGGNYYGFKNLNVGKYRGYMGLFVRKDLLDEWGLDVPTTIDDWSELFKVAKEHGVKYPLTGNSMLMGAYCSELFNSAWGISTDFFVDGKTVKFGPFEPEFKDYVAKMREWVELGYVDIDYITNDSSIIHGYMTNGTSIAARGYAGGDMGKILPAMETRDPNYELVACPFPVMKKGELPKFQPVQGEATDPCIAISTQCGIDNEDRYKEAISWCDYLYSEDGMILKCFGVEGDTFTIEKDANGEEHFVYTDKILKDYEEIGATNIGAALYHYFLPANHPGFNQHPDYFGGYYSHQAQKDAIEIWNLNVDVAKRNAYPAVSFTGEEAARKADIESKGKANLVAGISNIILGKASMDTFDDAIAQAKKAGYDELLKIRQDAYDRYISVTKK